MNQTPEGWTFEDLREALDDYDDPGEEYLSAQDWANRWGKNLTATRELLNRAVEKEFMRIAKRRGRRGDGVRQWFTVYAKEK